MKSCPEHLETLWLDVHGELAPGESRQWRAHLQNCPACREERQRLALLVEETRQALAPDGFSAEEEDRLGRAVLDRLERDRRSKLAGLIWPRVPRPAYALAAACLAALAVGWIWSGPVREPHPLQTASRLESVGITRNADGEILQDLELLEELDVIEKVVTVIDNRQISM